MSRMPAYTMCLASARARTVIAPNPLEAPVTRMTLGFDMRVVLSDDRGRELDNAAVGIDDLAIDPAGRTGEEGDGFGDVVGLAQALQRRGRLRAVDDLLRLALEIERRRGRPRRDGV